MNALSVINASVTAYAFNVTAKDLTGNVASNNPIVLQAKTAVNTNTSCAGISGGGQEGSF